MQNIKVLYVHGMRGGEDSRIPSILATHFDVCIRTYDFDPETAGVQIRAWADEYRPDVVVGESMGAIHALSLDPEIPVILVSPALNVGYVFSRLAWLSLIPGVKPILNHIYRPYSERRQKVNFDYVLLRKWERCRAEALKQHHSYVFAFFGTADKFRRSGIVSIKTYSRYFGTAYSVYEGTHFMEEEYIESLLVPAILNCRS